MDDEDEIIEYENEAEVLADQESHDDDDDDYSYATTEDYVDIPLIIVPRDEWGALPPTSQIPFKPLITGTVFAYSESDTCDSKEHCMKIMRDLQKRDVEENGMPDIQYNFYIGDDLKVYEGRGWHAASTQGVKDYAEIADKTISVCYIGHHEGEDYPSELVMQLNIELLDFGVANGYMREDYNHYPVIVPLDD